MPAGSNAALLFAGEAVIEQARRPAFQKDAKLAREGERHFALPAGAGAQDGAGNGRRRNVPLGTDAGGTGGADLIFEEGGVGVARQDQDDINAGAAEFEAEGVREGAEGELAGGVDGIARCGEDAEDAANVDDLAAALPAQMGQDRLEAAEGAEEIHVHQALGLGEVGLFDRGAHAEAGIVDEDVHAAEPFDGGRHEVLDVGVASDIGHDGDDAGTESGEGVAVAGGGDDVGAGGSKGERGFAANARGGAGDDDDFVGEVVFHFRYFRGMV